MSWKKSYGKVQFLLHFEAEYSGYYQIWKGVPQNFLVECTSCFLAAYLVQADEDNQFCQVFVYQNGSKGLMWHYIIYN